MNTCDALIWAAGLATVVCCGHAAAQATDRSDATDWASFVQAPAEPARVEQDRDHMFSEVARGGPWREPARGTLAPDAARLSAMLAASQWPEALALLKASDPPVGQRDAQGRTPLTLAIQGGQMPLVRELIRRGAPLNDTGLGGFTPLGLAAYRGQDLIVRELVRQGADLDTPGLTGQPPLHLACVAGQPRAVAALLRERPAASDWRQFNREGRHAVAEAAYHGHLAVLMQLQAAGFSMQAPDRHRLNALHAAALGRQPEVLRYLQAQGVPLPTAVTQVLIDQMAM